MESSSSSNMPFENKAQVLLDLNVPLAEDPDLLSDHTSKGEFRKVEPEWLGKFIGRTFFDPCSEHSIWRNERNKYCVDCDAPLCQYCVSAATHNDHTVLKIYRHVYKNVTPLDAILELIDCSQIQPYRCNKQNVLALTPLPHMGTKIFKDEELCKTCKRRLIEHNVHSYCSIFCKVDAFIKKEDDDSPPFLALKLEQLNTAVDQLVPNAEQETEPKESPVNQLAEQEQEQERPMTNLEILAEMACRERAIDLRKRKRKGSPHRSPFF
ncbi:hypothetical protein RND81_08G206900 [Saponaria officinalis]|uniref:B box-type domain-containing protein n=1 Tax=Saponaria officinalis TaxID=3572 RepID=A0AAW1J9W6_SAPOF